MNIPSTLAHYRRNFHRASKSPDESISDWHRRLTRLAEPCRFGNDLNKFLLEMFVSGLDDSLFDRLLSENCDLTFDRVINVISEYERALTKCDDDNLLPTRAAPSECARIVHGSAINALERDQTGERPTDQVRFPHTWCSIFYDRYRHRDIDYKAFVYAPCSRAS